MSIHNEIIEKLLANLITSSNLAIKFHLKLRDRLVTSLFLKCTSV